jgi:gliding motility-associated-like protein
MPVTFTSQSTTLNSGSVNFLWRIDNTLNFSGISIKNTFLNKGIYKVLHFAIPSTCPQLTDSIEKNIIIDEPIKGIKYPPVNVFSNKPFVLSARNIGNSFLWSPNQNLNNSQIRNPILITNREQLFQIRISQSSGCVTVDTQLVRVFNASEIYVPKGFTPDNDGSNDRLYPILVGIQEMRYFTIMNRWGNVIYNNKNASLTTGWDGTFKGTKLPMDTYVWIAEGIDVDGKIITRSGNTILIR